MKILNVDPAFFNSLRDLVKASRKIEAIKTLRIETEASLRECKHAIDNLGQEMGISNYRKLKNNECVVVAAPRITKVTVQVGLGEVEVDLAHAEFLIMKELGNVPLGEMRRLLSLIEVLHKYSSGEEVSRV